MQKKSSARRLWPQVAIAVGSVAAAALVQYAAWIFLGLPVLLPPLFLAVILSAWFGGAGAALATILLGAVFSVAMVSGAPPGTMAALPGLGVLLALYFMVSVAAAYCIVALRLARDRAAESGALAVRRLEELQVEQERTDGVLSSISDAVIRVDQKGRVTYWNAAAAGMTGFSREAATGRPLDEVVQVSDAATGLVLEGASGSIRDVLGSGRALRLAAPGGVTIPVEASVSPAPGGDAVITLRDISERRRGERMRAEGEQRFRILADSAPVLIWVSTPDRQREYVNRHWLEFTGRALEQETGEGWLESVHPDDRTRVRRGRGESYDARRAYTLEYRLRNRDGQYRWIFDRGVPRFGPGGEFLGYIGSAIDVTERKQAEERYRTIVETANEGVWLTSPDGRTVYANVRMASLLGCSAEQVQAQGVTDFCFAEDVQEARRHIAVNLAGQTESFDFRFRRADGQPVLVIASTSPLRDSEGLVVGALGMFSDVTERRRAMTALLESEERFRQLAENLEDVIWIYDLGAARVVYASPAYERLWGQSLQALLDDPSEWIVPVHPDDRAHVRTAFERMRAGHAFDEEYRILRPDGATLWIRDRGFPVAGDTGLPYRVIGIAEDITARKQAEMALRESEARQRALLESASQGVVASDDAGRIVLVNAKTEELFGYSRSELLGQPLEMLVPEASRHAHQRQMVEYFGAPRHRPMGIGLDLAGRKKNGEVFPVEISLSYLSEGGARLALALITDITERKRFEEQMRETARLESLGVLAGGIAHDFNNILTGIMGNASLAMEALGDPALLRSLMESVVHSSERAAHLTHQMLAYSGKGRFIVGPVDVSQLLRDIADLLRGSISRTVHLSLELHPDPPLVEADVAQLQQVAMNLVINAAEAIGERPGVVAVRTGVCRVEESDSRGNLAGADLAPGDYVCMEVRDDGCGMDEATRSRMFDPFFTTKFTGRGLGLAATLGIVRGHNGAIRVDTAPGQGATVTVFLPPAPTQDRVPQAPAPGHAVRRHGVVLVVDDEEMVRQTAAASLRRAGYQVLQAENGRAAIEMFAKAEPAIDLVVLDMTMPVMSGEETLARIRTAAPAVPVLLSSGYGEQEALRRFQGHTISGFAQKPYTASSLVEQVDAVLSGDVKPWLVQPPLRDPAP